MIITNHITLMRCPDYDDPEKNTDETADEYLCDYCSMRGTECDGKGNMNVKWEDSIARQRLRYFMQDTEEEL